MQILHYISLFSFLAGLFFMGKHKMATWTLMVFFATVEAYSFYKTGFVLGCVSHLVFAFLFFYGSFVWTITKKNELDKYPNLLFKILSVTVILILVSGLFGNFEFNDWFSAITYVLMAIAFILFSIYSVWAWGILLSVSIANSIAVLLSQRVVNLIDNSQTMSIDMYFFPAVAVMSIYGFINQQFLSKE